MSNKGFVPTVGRVVHVFRKGPKGWAGPRPAQITRVDSTGGINVSVLMDHNDEGHPPVVRFCNVHLADEPGKIKAEDQTDGTVWAEWPPRVG